MSTFDFKNQQLSGVFSYTLAHLCHVSYEQLTPERRENPGPGQRLKGAGDPISPMKVTHLECLYSFQSVRQKLTELSPPPAEGTL